MSEMAKRARQAMKGKIASLVRTDPKMKVDASGYTPPDALDADVKTGMRPISRRQFKKGGKVVAVHGKEAVHHAGKKPRRSGGRALTADSLINRSLKEANQSRDGYKHVGGMKRGGRTHKDLGGLLGGAAMNGVDPKIVAGLGADALRKRGGRAHKQVGGAMADPRLAALARNPRAIAAARMMAARAGMPMGRKSGGKAEHPDEAEDKALIKSMIKSSAMKHGKAHGGSCDCPACTSMRSRKAHGGSCRCAKCMGGRSARKDGGGNWIKDAIKHKGSLHKALHVAADEKIPAKKLAKAAHSSNPKLAKKAHLAQTLKRMHRDEGGEVMSYNDNDKPPSGGVGSTLNNPVERQRLIDSLKNKPPPKPKKRGGSMSVSDGSLEGTRPTGGRLARKSGGRAGKGKMNVNIIIGAHKPEGQGMMPPQGPQGPQGIPVPAPPTGPGAAGPAGMPPGMMPAMPTAPSAAPPGMPMPRKTGGRVGYNPKQDGGGGGLGRLHKAKAYGKNAEPTKEHY